MTRSFTRLIRAARRPITSAALVAVVAAPAWLWSAGPATAQGSYPTSHTLNLSFLQDPGQPPDPDVYYAGQGLELTRNLYEGLLTYKPDTPKHILEPSLATSWSVSSNGLTYTFQLRHGVLFHDGTPFTSAAIAPDFARRLAVNGGPSYMVQGVTVTAPNPYEVVMTLQQPNTAFLDFLASPYGPAMMSPTGLAAHAGTDNDQTYLQTHDLGTGPYTLTQAKVGVEYQLQAFPQYWGKKPYYTTVNMPVIDNLSSEEIQFNDGQLAAIMHDMTTSVIAQYRAKPTVKSYSLPTLESQTAYINENKGFLNTVSDRMAVLEAINVPYLVAGIFPGRAVVASQAGPAGIIPEPYGKQNIPYNPNKLKSLAKTLSAADKSFTIGYDTAAPDDQLLAEDIGAELQADGLNTKVVGYQTSSIYSWIGNAAATSGPSTPNLLIDYFWPDSYNTYMWTHISFDPTGGLVYMNCNVPGEAPLNAQAVATGSNAEYNKAIENAVATGCWLNIADQEDAMVAQPWLKGIPQSHNVATPVTLWYAGLYPGPP